MATSALLAAAAVLACAAPAFADVLPDTAPGITDPIAPPAPPGLPPRWQLAVHAGLRVTVLDAHGDRWAADAMAYGWRSAAARPLLGATVELSYLWAPIVDVGVSAGWAGADFAAGLDDNDRLSVHASSLAAVARLHWMQGRPFVPEPRVDAGVMRARTSVHGTPDVRYRTFLRAGVDWRLGTPSTGVDLALGYTMIDRDAGDPLSAPIGGLDLAIGPYFRF